LVVAEVRETLAVRKRAAQKIGMVRSNLRKLNEVEVKEQYQITVINRIAALQNLVDIGDNHRAWGHIRTSTFRL
jgi:hypothetical protein